MAVYTQESDKAIDVAPIMNPERILGALIWATAHGLMTKDLLALVDSLPPEYVAALEDDLNTMVRALQGARRDIDDPEIKQAIHQTALSELVSTLKTAGGSQ
jgi:hypothetical protein